LAQREKIRVYILARELNIETTDLLRLCEQAGYEVKNQLSGLDPDQRQTLEEMVKKLPKGPIAAAPAKPVTKSVTPELKAVPTIPRAPVKREPEPVRVEPAPAPPPPSERITPAVVETPTVAEEQTVPARSAAAGLKDRMPNLAEKSTPPAAKPTPPSPAPAVKTEPAAAPTTTKPEVKTEAPRSPAAPAPRTGPIAPPRPPQDLGRTAARDTGSGRSPRSDQPRRPSAPTSQHQHLKPIAPPSLKPQGRAPEKPAGPTVIKPIIAITKDHIEQSQNKPIRMEDLVRPQQPIVEEPAEDEEGGKKDKKRAIPGREQRQKERNERAEKRKTAKPAVEIVDGKIVETEVEVHHRSRSGRRLVPKPKTIIKQRPTALELDEPITIRG
jgi:hypothetical protein